MAEESFMVTTIDNPYNPFTNFVEWLLYDNEKGYKTVDKIGRLTYSSDELSEEEAEEENNRVIDELIANDPLPIYVKVKASDYKNGKFLEKFPQKVENFLEETE